MGKRKWRGGGAGGKRHRGGGDFSMAKKRPVLLATCVSNRGREAARELSTLIEGVLETPATPGAEDGADEAGTVQDELQREIAALKAEKEGQAAPFQTIRTDCAGLAGAYFQSDTDVVELSRRLGEEVGGGATGVRFLNRVIPLQHTAHGDEAGACEVILTLLSKHFGAQELQGDAVAKARIVMERRDESKEEAAGDEANTEAEAATEVSPKVEAPRAEENDIAGADEVASHKLHEDSPQAADVPAEEVLDRSGVTYMVHFAHRHHEGITRDFVRGVVRGLLPPKHRVDYKAAQVVIVVEAIKGMVGAAMLRGGMPQFEALNLHKLAKAADNVHDASEASEIAIADSKQSAP